MFLITWCMGIVEKYLKKYIPDAAMSFEPFVLLVIMLPIALCGLGPIGTVVGTWINNIILWIHNIFGPLGIALIGALYIPLVGTGMHLPVITTAVVAFSSYGFDDTILVGAIPAVYAMIAIDIIYVLKARNAEDRAVGISCLVTQAFVGLGEPSIFSILFRYKKALLVSVVATFFGALYAGLMHCAVYMLPISNALVASVYAGGGSSHSFIHGCIACGISFVTALVMMLMLSAFPRIDTPASYLIFRTTRLNWLIGQIITVFVLTFGYCLMILLSSIAMCIGCNVFAANHWSETATMLSFSPASFEVALTVMRKTVKLTTPWGCCYQIFGLLFQYVLLLSMIQLLFTVLKSKKAGIIAALVLNFAGFVLTPDRFMAWLNLPMEMRYYANLLSAWLSPLQHATYTMHNFGYDLLPRLHVSYLILGGVTAAMVALSMLKMRTFQFSFTGGYSDE